MGRSAVVALGAVGVLVLAGACVQESPAGPTPAPSATSDGTTTTSPTSPSPSPTPSVTGLPQPAIWPDAATVLTSPQAAAADFVEEVLDVPALLGEYRAGDSRSGEIPLLFSGSGSAADATQRSLLLVRRLGDGWFVLAAVHDHAGITSPQAGATVPAGPLTVTGFGRGFEGLVIVEALRPGDDDRLARVTTQGGSTEDAADFTVTLDLSGARPGETVVLLVRGGTGHDEDPGDLAAIPVVIG